MTEKEHFARQPPEGQAEGTRPIFHDFEDYPAIKHASNIVK